MTGKTGCPVCDNEGPPLRPYDRDVVALHRAWHDLWRALVAAVEPTLIAVADRLSRWLS